MITEMHRQQARAVTFMIAGLLGYSLIPLVIDVWADFDSIAVLVGCWALIYGAIGIIAAYILQLKLDVGLPARTVLNKTPWWVYVVTFFGALQWVFFAWSSHLTETAVTTVIFESWPILVLVGRWSFKTASGKKRVTFSDITLVAVAGVGLILVILSESVSDADSLSVAGVVLAILGSVTVAASIVAVLSGGEIAAERLEALGNGGLGSEEQSALRTRASALSRGTMWVAAGSGLLIFAIFSPSVFSLQVLAVGVFLGALHGVSSFAFTYANHLSHSDTINSLYYLVPALALGWLWTLTDVTVADPQLFVAGAVGVIAINMVIHLDPEGAGDGQDDDDGPVSGYGFKALVIALWASGSLMVLRDDWLPEGMLQWGAGEYWGILALLATVFVFNLVVPSAAAR